MSSSFKTTILPDYSQAGDLHLSYDLDGPEMYASMVRYEGTHYPEIIGVLFVVIVFVKYSVKALVTVPESPNPGNIIPHLFAYKIGALLLYPTYIEYMQFCYGFMAADFPWANKPLGEALGNFRDISPQAYKVFYTNMNLGSMHFIASCIALFLFLLTFTIGKALKN